MIMTFIVINDFFFAILIFILFCLDKTLLGFLLFIPMFLFHYILMFIYKYTEQKNEKKLREQRNKKNPSEQKSILEKNGNLSINKIGVITIEIITKFLSSVDCFDLRVCTFTELFSFTYQQVDRALFSNHKELRQVVFDNCLKAYEDEISSRFPDIEKETYLKVFDNRLQVYGNFVRSGTDIQDIIERLAFYMNYAQNNNTNFEEGNTIALPLGFMDNMARKTALQEYFMNMLIPLIKTLN